MKLMTWNRQSHGLFDYECKLQGRTTIETNMSSTIARKKNENMVTIEDIDFNTGDENHKPILKIHR